MANKNNNLAVLVEEFNHELAVQIKGLRVWIDNYGIIRVDGKNINWSEKELDVIMNAVNKYRDTTIPNSKILFEIGTVFQMPPREYRKRVARDMKDAFNKIKFKKLAIAGGGTISRVVLSFILTTLGLKNIKHFHNEKKALEWLKED